ncbi:MAG: hypothetical protein OEQ53_19010 [Saprospiraceae bacterium]|nr:hypothetical protein [Saprospiraceae bacterium]
MKKEFKTLREGLAWIAFHAISQLHLKILSEELTNNHRFTGHYFIHTIVHD